MLNSAPSTHGNVGCSVSATVHWRCCIMHERQNPYLIDFDCKNDPAYPSMKIYQCTKPICWRLEDWDEVALSFDGHYVWWFCMSLPSCVTCRIKWGIRAAYFWLSPLWEREILCRALDEIKLLLYSIYTFSASTIRLCVCVGTVCMYNLGFCIPQGRRECREQRQRRAKQSLAPKLQRIKRLLNIAQAKQHKVNITHHYTS